MEPLNKRFKRLSWVIFWVVAGSYLLSYFHRMAPAIITVELSEALKIGGASLGFLASTYFIVHTFMQIPTGILADFFGPKWILVAGSLTTMIGCVLFAVATSFPIAVTGRFFVGLGTSVTFIAFLKLNAAWFPPHRFASINGLTIMIGNFGAFVGATPFAWIVKLADWRTTFWGLATISFLLSILTWQIVYDRPEDIGKHQQKSHPARKGKNNPIGLFDGLKEVMGNPATWPGFWVNLGICGSFFCFSGLWSVPFLMEVYGMDNVTAANHNSLLLIGVAVGALFIGNISDRFKKRRSVMVIFASLFCVSWIPLLIQVVMPLWLSYTWFLCMGIVIPSYTLTWTVAKEVNRPELSGMATGFVNVGCFLGAALMQPLVGWALDLFKKTAGVSAGYQVGIAILLGFTLLGSICAFFIRETNAVNQVAPRDYVQTLPTES